MKKPIPVLTAVAAVLLLSLTGWQAARRFVFTHDFVFGSGHYTFTNSISPTVYQYSFNPSKLKFKNGVCIIAQTPVKNTDGYMIVEIQQNSGNIVLSVRFKNRWKYGGGTADYFYTAEKNQDFSTHGFYPRVTDPCGQVVPYTTIGGGSESESIVYENTLMKHNETLTVKFSGINQLTYQRVRL